MRTCPKCHTPYPSAAIYCSIDGSLLADDQSAAPSPAGADDPLIGATLDGRYQVETKIGEGGMGVVYQAVHTGLDKKVALKVLREDYSRKEGLVARFHQEARSAAKIRSPHIIEIYDFGRTSSGQTYIAMEYLVGDDLANVIANGPLKAPRVVRIAKEVCAALQAAHEKGIIHRDMKPENIFLCQDRASGPDHVKVLDFGIAKMSDMDAAANRLTKTGMIFGTPEYMSPEQAGGYELDNRVDIYALGVILFEMLTGDVPFKAETFMGILRKHMFDKPDSPRKHNAKVPRALERVVLKALEKDKNKRYPDCNAMWADIESGCGHLLNADAGAAVQEPEPEPEQAAPAPQKTMVLPEEEIPAALERARDDFRRSSPVPRRSSPEPRRSSPVPRRSSPVPRQPSPPPRRPSPRPAAPSPRRPPQVVASAPVMVAEETGPPEDEVLKTMLLDPETDDGPTGQFLPDEPEDLNMKTVVMMGPPELYDEGSGSNGEGVAELAVAKTMLFDAEGYDGVVPDHLEDDGPTTVQASDVPEGDLGHQATMMLDSPVHPASAAAPQLNGGPSMHSSAPVMQQPMVAPPSSGNRVLVIVLFAVASAVLTMTGFLVVRHMRAGTPRAVESGDRDDKDHKKSGKDRDRDEDDDKDKDKDRDKDKDKDRHRDDDDDDGKKKGDDDDDGAGAVKKGDDDDDDGKKKGDDDDDDGAGAVKKGDDDDDDGAGAVKKGDDSAGLFAVEVVTDPAGAAVLLEGEHKADTPGVIKLPGARGDKVTVRIEKSGFTTVKRVVVLGKDDKITVKLVPGGSTPAPTGSGGKKPGAGKKGDAKKGDGKKGDGKKGPLMDW